MNSLGAFICIAIIVIVGVLTIQYLFDGHPIKNFKLIYLRNQCKAFKDEIERWRYERELKRTPVYAKLVTFPETRETGYGTYKAVKRALIGDWAYGAAGAIIGAMTTPENDRTTVTEVTFLVRYKDNHAGEETVDIKGQRCRELLAVLDEEQAEALLIYNSLF